MGRIPDIKRLRKEDFDADNQELVDRIAFAFNTFADQVINLFNKNIDFQNLNQEITEVTVSTNSSGSIDNPPKIKSNLNKRIQGIICIRVDNLTNPVNYISGYPFISFSLDQNIINILNIANLANNTKYKIKLLLIGED